MKKARVSTETKTYVHCPNCGERAGSIGHLLRDEFAAFPVNTSWGCGDCGFAYNLQINSPEDIQVEVNDKDGCNTPCLHVLELSPRMHPVYVVILAKDYGRGRPGKEPFDGAEYYYNSHTCPTNWTKEIKFFIYKGDSDPHGLFEYRESIDLPPKLHSDDAMKDLIRKSFPHLFEDAGEGNSESAASK